MSRYMVFYQGLRPQVYYWEFVNTLRKILLICINVLIPIQNLFLKAALALVMMVFFLRLQIFLKPYKLDVISKIEQREFYVSIITIYASFLYQVEDLS